MVQPWVKNIVEETLGKHLEIGMVVIHPETKNLVKITGGQFWGEHGMSNFWYWREILSDGSLSEKEYHGYGWEPTYKG